MTLRVTSGVLGIVVVAGAALGLQHLGEVALLPTPHWTGWLLFLAVLFLLAQGFRRRWARESAPALVHIHACLGWITLLIFALHAGGLPDGWFQRLLWILFVLALGSGVAGQLLQRLCASRQRQREALPHGRIAEQRALLAAGANDAFHELVRQGCPPALASTYARRVLPFLAGPANLWEHWIGSRRPLDELLQEVDRVGQAVRSADPFVRLRNAVAAKADLDQRWALHWLQQGWLFVHIPASAASVVLVLFHIVFVHAFGG